MKSVAAVVAVIALAGAGVFAQKAPSADEAAIAKVRTAYQQAALGDATAMAKLYAADGVAMPPNAPMAKGRAAIEAYYKKFFEQVMMHGMTITPSETRVMGDRAYDAGTYKQQIMMMNGGGGGVIDDHGKYIVLLKKEGGAWVITHAIYNSDLPAAAPPKK